MRKPSIKTRERFGLDEAPTGSIVEIGHMEGTQWYVLWKDRPTDDKENILASHFGTKKKACQYAEDMGWVIQNK